MAKLTTKNKTQVYNAFKKEFYANINDIMQKQYKKNEAAMKYANSEDKNFFEQVFGTYAAGMALGFDVYGGAIGSIGNAVTGLVQYIADTMDNMADAFDPNDDRGFFEDMGYALAKIPSDLIKGLGTAGVGVISGAGELFGIEGSKEFGTRASNWIESKANDYLVSAIRSGRQLDKNIKGENDTFEKLSSETYLDSDEEIKQYINDRYDPEGMAEIIKQGATNLNQNYWQKQIADPIKNVLDKYVEKTWIEGTYNQILEPVANSIGEILPSMILGNMASQANSLAAMTTWAASAKAYFMANTYGRSYQEAIAQGATDADAHIYGIGMTGIELGTEQISAIGGKFFGGFNIGQPLATSYGSVMKSILTEGFEEAVAEVAQPAMEVFLSETRDPSQVTPVELRERVLYSALVGGISGGIFGGVGMMQARVDINTEMEILNQQFKKNAEKRDPKLIGESVTKLVEKMNAGRTPQWRIDAIMQNRMYSTLIQKNEDGQYELTSVGQRFSKGQVYAQQGDNIITKKDYVVGADEYAIDYMEELEVQPAQYDAEGNVVQEAVKTKIELVKNEDIKTLPKKLRNDIKFFQDMGIRFALYRDSSQVTIGDSTFSQGGFTNVVDGVIYLNANNETNIEQGIKSVYAHEIHDKMKLMYDNGLLTQKQFEAYQQFESEIDTGKLDTVLEEIGWFDKEVAYRQQYFTKRQKQQYQALVQTYKAYEQLTPEQQQQLGYDSSKSAEYNATMAIELNSEQKSFINRERVSNVIDTVFDTEAILRRAFQKNPSIFRKIANIFTKPDKFKTMFNFSKETKADQVLQDMLNNMQVNFTKVLKEGSDFIFGPETILDGLLQVNQVFKPQQIAFQITSNDNLNKKVYDVPNPERLNEITQSEEAMAEIVGYKPEYKKVENPKTAADFLNNIDADYFQKNEPQMIDEESAEFYRETTSKNYFYKVGNKLYNKDDFKIPEGAKDVKIKYVDNNYFKLEYRYSPIESDVDTELGLDGTIYNKMEIYPDLELADGTIIEKPLMLATSLNPSRMEFFMKNKVSPITSINIQSATAMTLGTKYYEQVFEGENGHKYVMTIVYDPMIVESPGFMAYRNDANTPVLKTRQEGDEGNTELYDELVGENENIVLAKVGGIGGKVTHSFAKEFDGNNYILLEFKKKTEVLKSAINTMINQAQNKVMEVVGENNENNTQEVVSKNLGTLMNALDKMSKTYQTRYTRETLKKDIFRQHKSPGDVLMSGKKAVASLRYLLDKLNLNTLGRALAIEVHGNNNFEFDSSIIAARKQYQKYFKDIVDFMQMYDYNITSVAEAQHPKITPDMGSVAVITHIGGNLNSSKYQQHKAFFEENFVRVIDLEQQKTMEQLKQEAGYQDKTDAQYQTSSHWMNYHVDAGNSSVMDAVSEVAHTSPVVFQVTVDKSKKTQSTKNQAKNRKPVVGTNPKRTVSDTQTIVKSKTKNTKTTLEPQLSKKNAARLQVEQQKLDGLNAQWKTYSLARRKANQTKNRTRANAYKKAMEALLSEINLVQSNIEMLKQGQSLPKAEPQVNKLEVPAEDLRRTRIEEVRALKDFLVDLEKSRAQAVEQEDANTLRDVVKSIKETKKKIQDLEAEIENQSVEQTQEAPIEQTQPEIVEQTQETKTTEQRKEEIVQEVMDLIGTWTEQQTRQFLETKSIEQGMEVPLQDSRLDALTEEYTSLLQQDAQTETQQPAPVEQTQQVDDSQTTPPPTTPQPAPIQQNAQLDYQAIIDAQQTAKAQTDNVYKKTNKAFRKFLQDLFKNLRQIDDEDTKNLVKLYDKYESIIRKEVRGGQMINHMSVSVLQTLINELGIIYDRASRADARTDYKLTNAEKARLIQKVNEAIFSTIQYLNDITSKRYVSENNPEGLLYAKFSHWYLREFLEADLTDPAKLVEFAESDTRGNFYRRLLNAINNINDENGYQELFGAIEQFVTDTDIDKVNDLALDGDKQRTIKEVRAQWLRNLKNQKRIKESTKYKTAIPIAIAELTDPYTFLQIQGLFNNSSWANVLYERLIQAQENMIEIDRVFNDVLQLQEYLKKNFDDIAKLDKKTLKIENLGDATLSLSQIVFLRDMIVREIARNKAIDMGIIEGNKSKHFQDGFIVNILKIADNNIEKTTKQQEAKIKNVQELLNELEVIIQNEQVAQEYNNRILDLFSRLYPYVNERHMEIDGQPLQNEGIEIKKALEQMDDTQKQEFFDTLPDSVNQDNIDKVYVPILIGESGYFKDDNAALQNIIDLGVFDGMAQSISEESTSPVSVDTITNIIFKYKQEVRNYYGLHRIMKDWNSLVNERIPGMEQDMNFKQFINSQAVKYIEKLMKDMAGYRPRVVGQKVQGQLKRNFYRAALAGNIKVIFTQLTTLHNLSILYGVNVGKMYAKLLAQLSPKNKRLLEDMMRDNNIMYDRSFKPTLDIAESRNQGFLENSRFNRFVDIFMSGISGMDNAINKAFFLTLLETTNPETNKPYTPEEANEIVKKAILRSQSTGLDLGKAPIFRTDNDILKLFVKFLGEPNKLQNQIYLAKKKLEYVKKVENNSQEIEQELDKQEAEKLIELQEQRRVLDELNAKEESDDFATLENDEQQKIRDDIENQQSVVENLEEEYTEIQQEVQTIKQELVEAVASKSQTRQNAIRASATLISAMFYMASLGVAWGLLLSDMGNLDDREEDEELMKYLARKMGVAMGNEVAGLFPIIRDVYGLMVDGYDIDTIDELGAIQDSLLIVRQLFLDIKDGKDINVYKLARDIAIYGGRVFGVPTRNLEKIGIMYMLNIGGNEDAYYRYRQATGQRTASNKELARAIKEGDDSMIEAIVETKMGIRNVNISRPVMDEMIDLSRLGYNVNVTAIKDSYTIDGIEYKLEEKDKTRFRAIYSQADFVIQRMITSPSYRRLSDDKKRSLITSIYTYYLKLAQQTVLGVDVLPESRQFRTLNQVYRYFTDIIVPRLLKEQQEERRDSRRQRPINTDFYQMNQ